jgi:hypothetical protein
MKTFSASHVDGELAGDGESVTELRLSGSKFHKEFGDRAGLHSAVQKLVQFFRAGCYLRLSKIKNISSKLSTFCVLKFYGNR